MIRRIREGAALDRIDDQWKVLEPLIGQMPRQPDGHGRPWRDSRTVLNGTPWILRTGAKQSECPLPALANKDCPTPGSTMCMVRSAGGTMPGRTLTGYAPACLAPEANCATSAVAARVRYNPLSYQLTLLT